MFLEVESPAFIRNVIFKRIMVLRQMWFSTRAYFREQHGFQQHEIHGFQHKCGFRSVCFIEYR